MHPRAARRLLLFLTIPTTKQLLPGAQAAAKRNQISFKLPHIAITL